IGIRARPTLLATRSAAASAPVERDLLGTPDGSSVRSNVSAPARNAEQRRGNGSAPTDERDGRARTPPFAADVGRVPSSPSHQPRDLGRPQLGSLVPPR